MEEDDVVDGYFYFAKSCFLCREYRRAAHWLRDQNGRKAMFLRFYALYMVCLPFIIVNLHLRPPSIYLSHLFFKLLIVH